MAKVYEHGDVKITVDEDACIGCGACVSSCPQGVYELIDEKSHAVRVQDCCKTMMEKQQVDKVLGARLINHGCTTIITAFDAENNRPTGMTAQWVMPLARTLLCVKFGPLSHTGKLAVANGAFVVNVPTKRNLQDVIHFGAVHGNTADKFAASGLHTTECATAGMGALVVAECVAALECRVVDTKTFADGSVLVTGEVVACWASPRFFRDGFYTYGEDTDEEDLTLHHFGGGKYGVSRRFV